MKSTDLRVIKTRKNIEDSFIRLLSKNDFNKITIQDILNEALINRSTFYKHYEDKYALAQFLGAQVYNDFTVNIDKRFKQVSYDNLIDDIQCIYNSIYEKREIIMALWKITTNDIHLYDDMNLYLKNSFLSGIINDRNQPSNIDYIAAIYATLVLTSVKWIFEHGGYESIKESINIFFPVLSDKLNSLNLNH